MLSADGLNVKTSAAAAEAVQIWRDLGHFWDDYTGPTGRPFHKQVLNPVTEALLDIKPGERVLDIACGNGHFSRRLAGLGASVTACDVSETCMERAMAHTAGESDITYLVMDVTNRDALRRLGRHCFDAAVASMAFMDISDHEPLMAELRFLLKPNGRVVFSVLHPCFGYLLADAARAAGMGVGGPLLHALSRAVPAPVRARAARAREVVHLARQSLRYLESGPRRGYGIKGQPRVHWYFHRPLAELLKPAFAHGFVVDALVEPGRPGDEGRAGPLVVRLRPSPIVPARSGSARPGGHCENDVG